MLGTLELIDEGETDYKILVIRMSDPLAQRVTDINGLEAAKPGVVGRLRDWLIKYKTAEGKGLNTLADETPYSVQEVSVGCLYGVSCGFNALMCVCDCSP